MNNPRHSVFVAYVLIPWVGVTAVGYGLGQIYRWTSERRQAFLLRLGLALTAAFLVLRAINIYGDPVRWAAQKSAAFTVLSFLNTAKYPPSLLFLLMTLGPALLFLRAVGCGTPRFLRPALIIGKVPMFYYLLHTPLIHLLAVMFAMPATARVHWMFESPTSPSIRSPPPPGWGFSLPIVYLIWTRRFCYVPALPLVCGFEATSQRSLAQLFLKRDSPLHDLCSPLVGAHIARVSREQPVVASEIFDSILPFPILRSRVDPPRSWRPLISSAGSARPTSSTKTVELGLRSQVARACPIRVALALT